MGKPLRLPASEPNWISSNSVRQAGEIMRGLFKSGGAGKPTTAESELADDARQRLALLEEFESSGIGWFWASDAEGKITYISGSAATAAGKSASEIVGVPIGSLFAPDQDESSERAARTLPFLMRARNSINEVVVRVGDGEREVWWSITGRPHSDADGEFQGYRGSAKDVTSSYQQQKDASRLAQFDELTGLSNRHRMSKRLNAILTAYQAAKRSCALIMVDLDRFKQVNDTLGHPAGDELLKQVAQRLERIVDKGVEIGRLGGDEFQIILPDVDDRGKLGEIAARIIQMISQPYSIEGSRAVIGTSVGIAIAPYDGITSDELVKAADLALYAAKGDGRGQYRFYSSELKDSAQGRREIEEDLRDALSRGELCMHYQPIVRASDNMVTGFEALMRWNHPERGQIHPTDFIPIAEETSLINQIGEWAIRQACEDAAKWPGTLRVAVNVSANQFSAEALPAIVASALATSGLAPKRLELEITESVFMGDADAVDSMFTSLKGLGVRLALDDFGTGYSSLGYLRKAPFDKIKIDQTFVRGSTEPDNSNSAIIAAIVSLADALGMETTAEGVEAMDELELVKQRGATHVQGFIYSRAISPEEVQERLESGNLMFEPVGPAKHRSERRRLFRSIGVIHENHRYDAILRDLSKGGARIEGLLEVPVGTKLVLDLGGGQLAVCTVRRSQDATQGVEFEQQLVNDGRDNLVTRHRVSPYALAAAGMPLSALPPGHYPLIEEFLAKGGGGNARFMQVEVNQTASRAA
jgi:diguanylate cyclase (GGDEF)-like protein/PAS domain S-box-containing protein